MSPTHRQNLALLALKYLKHLEFAKAASTHTSKSYANDLGQFLHPIGVRTILYSPEDNERFSVRFYDDREDISSGNAHVKLESEVLVELVREAQIGWRKLKNSSRSRKLAVVKSWMTWLYQEKYIENDLSAQVLSPKIPGRLPRFISVDEAMTLIRSFDSRHDPNRDRDRLLILLLYGGGLRVSEACQLKWRNVEEDGKILRIMGKGQKERLVALPLLVANTLHKYPRSGDWVFGNSALSTRLAYSIVRNSAAAAGLVNPLNPHALRHSYATHLLSSGADLRVLQELLGHTSLVATQKYTHLTVDHIARALESHHPLSNDKE